MKAGKGNSKSSKMCSRCAMTLKKGDPQRVRPKTSTRGEQ